MPQESLVILKQARGDCVLNSGIFHGTFICMCVLSIVIIIRHTHHTTILSILRSSSQRPNFFDVSTQWLSKQVYRDPCL